MKTKRIYYDDAFAREFEAQVVSCEEVEGSEPGKWRVLLDQTVFYPTSGGQPHDLGWLGETRVSDVVDQGEPIRHLVDRPVTGSVAGKIDWERRFDHMQQHTGQHLLSAVLQGKFGLQTVSFHLGEELCTIDLRGAEPSAQMLVDAERAANGIIFEDRVVNARYGSLEELRALGVRKEVEREGILRAIEIEGVELQPCGGTHVAGTGQIGMILLRRCTKIRQDWRLEFLCGGRAATAARGDYDARKAVAELLKSSTEEIVGAAGKALAERDASFKSARERAERLAEVEAELIVRSAAVGPNGVRMIARVFEGTEATEVQLLATALAKHENTVALFARRECGHVFFGQHPSVGKDMNAIFKSVVEQVGGKGGGTKDFVRGALKDASFAHAAIELAKSLI
jgi:alanyl-tRNA synthetase